MTDTELIKDVCVMMCDVADDQVRFDNEGKHVFANITGFDDLSGCASNEAGRLQGGSDELRMHMIEIYHAPRGVFLDTERTNDKRTLFVG